MAVRQVRNVSMCVIMSSTDWSIPEPGVGVDLNPVAAESEFIVVRLRFPGELLVPPAPPAPPVTPDSPAGSWSVPGVPLLSAVFNWLAKIWASAVDDSLDQCERRAETKLPFGQASRHLSRSLLGRSCLIIVIRAVSASQC